MVMFFRGWLFFDIWLVVSNVDKDLWDVKVFVFLWWCGRKIDFCKNKLIRKYFFKFSMFNIFVKFYVWVLIKFVMLVLRVRLYIKYVYRVCSFMVFIKSWNWVNFRIIRSRCWL